MVAPYARLPRAGHVTGGSWETVGPRPARPRPRGSVGRRRVESAIFAGSTVIRRKYIVLVLESQPEGEEDLALRVHPAIHALFDAVDRAQRDLGLARELRLGHEAVLSELAHAVAGTGREHRLGILLFHSGSSSLGRVP